MQNIPTSQVLARIAAENTWWRPPYTIPENLSKLRPRAYLDLLYPLIQKTEVRRAVLLMGPRRVGKTVLVHHIVQRLLQDGVGPTSICYVSVDHPLYNGCSLEELLARFREAVSVPGVQEGYVFFDEIQYLRNWEVHLKSLVDTYPAMRFVASGSAAAALRLKSQESGAGRFTDFLLPPLTFHEYLEMIDLGGLVTPDEDWPHFTTSSVTALNDAFVNYLNYGGYPEVATTPAIQADPGRFVKNDIIDKVLLRDLPSLYGIQDIQELNYLFTTLAFNTANEVSLEELSKNSGVAKNTIRRYIDYLAAAFLIRTVHRIDRTGRRFQRANFFKVYLTNPSIRSALFAPIEPTDDAIGRLAETAIYAQWFHGTFNLYYARWSTGEVDIVNLNERHKPAWAVEVKYSDRFYEDPFQLKNLLAFTRDHRLAHAIVTTRTAKGTHLIDGCRIEFLPASLYCYVVGRNVIAQRGRQSPIEQPGRTEANT